MTFTSAGGRMPYFTKDYLAETGNCVDLSIAPKKRWLKDFFIYSNESR